MGAFGSDKTTTNTTTVTTNTVNDSRKTTGDNGIVAGGQVKISNGAEEAFAALEHLGTTLSNVLIESAKQNAASTSTLSNALTGFGNQSGVMFNSALGSIADLSKTKISDGANINAGTMKIALITGGVVLGVGGVALMLLRRKSA